ncbi:DUF1573 domain-containing protein [Sphingobacterium rhinopitheci]|uniref:DUF1573 domain-containing protein n=1 Tax=Sphingobacterium rhinopitheci TaxID=2781960 RepID=UPI001F52916B|nr:DUF1573 domain-containing protein [Sphingobacterium rhinopitheci]MCI0921413.1 DUF1573 domain-containing protein [Sphingobacterium rhinopitheci]
MINKFLFPALLLGLMTACNNQSSSSSSADSTQVSAVDSVTENVATGVIEFADAKYDFGTVKEGKVVDHVFKFKNTGTAPVIIAQVAASCGCTTPDYTRDPILPGKEGEIKVSFNSQGQVGNQQKIVTVSSNAANNVTTVEIKGTVEK